MKPTWLAIAGWTVAHVFAEEGWTGWTVSVCRGVRRYRKDLREAVPTDTVCKRCCAALNRQRAMQLSIQINNE